MRAYLTTLLHTTMLLMYLSTYSSRMPARSLGLYLPWACIVVCGVYLGVIALQLLSHTCLCLAVLDETVSLLPAPMVTELLPYLCRVLSKLQKEILVAAQTSLAQQQNNIQAQRRAMPTGPASVPDAAGETNPCLTYQYPRCTHACGRTDN